MNFHPLANLFPLLDGDAFETLVADVRANGLLEPIITVDGAILDGRNRYRAAMAADVAPRFVEWDGTGSMAAFVVSRNLHRRHLSESQRATVAAKIANMKQGERTDLPPIGGRLSQEDSAKLLNVSERSVVRAAFVQERGVPELTGAVERGEVKLGAAEAVAELLPVDRQRQVIAQGPKAMKEAAREHRQSRATKPAPTPRHGRPRGAEISPRANLPVRGYEPLHPTKNLQLSTDPETAATGLLSAFGGDYCEKLAAALRSRLAAASERKSV